MNCFEICCAFTLTILSFLPLNANDSKRLIKKQFCVNATQFESVSEAKEQILMEAKRLAVEELFGEVIKTFTSVENMALKKDTIISSSIGVIKVFGSPEYRNGDGLGDICVSIEAYITAEDLKLFDPVPLEKTTCDSSEDMTTKQLKKYVRSSAVTQALLNYEPRLKNYNGDLTGLIREIRVLSENFVPDTETYCVKVTGIVYPIELVAFLSEKIKRKNTKETSPILKTGDIFFEENFRQYNDWESLPNWGDGAQVRKTDDGQSYVTGINPGKTMIKRDVNFTIDFKFEYIWNNYCEPGGGDYRRRVHLTLIDDNGKKLLIKCGCYGAEMPRLRAIDFQEKGRNKFRLVKKGNDYYLYNNEQLLLRGNYPYFSRFTSFTIAIPVNNNGVGQYFTEFRGTKL